MHQNRIRIVIDRNIYLSSKCHFYSYTRSTSSGEAIYNQIFHFLRSPVYPCPGRRLAPFYFSFIFFLFPRNCLQSSSHSTSLLRVHLFAALLFRIPVLSMYRIRVSFGNSIFWMSCKTLWICSSVHPSFTISSIWNLYGSRKCACLLIFLSPCSFSSALCCRT